MSRARTVARWLIAGVAAVAMSGVGWAWWIAEADLVEVERRELVETIDVSGQLEAIRSLEYGPPPVRFLWNFKVAFIAPEGSEVGPGDPLLGFDATELEQRLVRREIDRDAAEKSIEKRSADLEIQMREAQLALSEARAALERAELKTDVPAEVIAMADLEKARLDRELATADVEYRGESIEFLQGRAQAELQLLEERRERAASEVRELERFIEIMTVRATRKGTVIHKTRRDGEKKKVGDRSWRGERVVEIPDLREMRVLAEVEESESGRLAIGQRAELTLDALPDRVFGAVVDRIHQTVERRSWRDRRKVMRLELSLDESDPALMRPGMRMQGSIEISRSAEILAIPATAIRVGEEGPEVDVGSGFSRGSRPISVGRRSGDWVEILDGLEEGERIVVGG